MEQRRAADAALEAAEGARRSKKKAPAKQKASAVQPLAPAAGEGEQQRVAAQDDSSSDVPVAVVETAAERKLREIQSQLEERNKLIEQLLVAQAAAAPLPSPHQSPKSGGRSLNAAAGAAAAADSQSRFARKEPRTQDLREYDGAAGDKLDVWLDELSLARMLYELNEREATRFAVSRLRGAALQWWLALDTTLQASYGRVESLASALRGRFQPVTAARTAREQLDKLSQGSRSVNDYISDFQRLRTQLPNMAEEDALYAFERGLRRDLAEKLRVQGVDSLQEAIAMAARVGGLMQGAAAATKSSLHQMDIDEPQGAGSFEERVSRAVTERLYAMQGSNGMWAKTQSHIGYQGQHQRGGGRGGRGGFRGGRGGFSQRPPPVVPGVSEHTVRQRLDARQCVRCGKDGHTSPGCPNPISGSGN